MWSCFQLVLVLQAHPPRAYSEMLLGISLAPWCNGSSSPPLHCPPLPLATQLCTEAEFLGGDGSCFS